MRKEDESRIADALGASRVVELGSKTVGGPLELLALREEFNQRLRSSGGRPTDPAWTVTRLVPFKEENWTRLQDLASEIGVSGRRVGPAQVAALLIENSLEELEEAQWQEDLAASRSAPLRSQPEAAEAAQVTYNQFDDWAQRGWIVPARRRGHERSYGADEIIRGHWLRSISKTDADMETIASAVRASDLSARYLVVTDGENVSTVPTRSQLYRLLEVPGSHLVIDQLPERRKLLGLSPFPADPNEELSVRRAV
jgi:DNA-binding transcriptional MerR regulator